MASLLVLDDDPEALEWMTASLSGVGHEVRGFRTARDALAALNSWQPELIVADVLMPEMDGIAFARLVRKHAGPPIMFISIAVSQAEAVLAGAVGYVQKPATANEIRAAVTEALGRPEHRATIMIVDDDDDTRNLFLDFLGPGYEVVPAIDGVDALAKLKSSHVDLVITDFHMPNMNGLDLIRAMRADPALERLPVIVQTSDQLALRSPVWRDLKVAYQMAKIDFARWLRRNIESSLPSAHAPGP